eukprot:TRINITY_DN28180_c0_g1_i1.p1 TRINITY_DN28180_c0_g1~~TRINITY_DN28180_c0_g1_i1.p1  ORF type:complete len:487 (-),score=49.12 TRINITY_DN28180_c0_g1_i1:233-1657(-)
MAPLANVPLRGCDVVPATREIVSRIGSQAGPAVLSNLFTFGTELVNTLFIGKFGDTNQLAAVGLANMMQNVFGLSIGIGLAGAIDTLSSQAYGAGETRLACLYMQRARLILTSQLVWIWPVLCFCDAWLTAIGQNSEIASLAAEYNRATAPFLLVYFQSACMRRLLSACLRPKGSMAISALVTTFHVAWVYLFVVRMGLGNTGLGLANGISWSTRFVLLSCLWWHTAPQIGLQRSWVLGFQSEALQGWRDYLKVGLPTLIQTSGEWWFWEICSLVVGYLGPIALAAHVATIQFITLPFMIPIGVGSGASALVGNAIGAGLPNAAKKIARVSVVLILVAWTVIAMTMVAFANQIASAFTRDEDVKSIMKALLYIYAAQGFFDAAQNVMGSILRGLGSMRLPSITYLIAFYVVMLPIAVFLAFPCGFGVRGVWLSMGIGTGFAALVFTRALARKDYDAMVGRARSRMCREEDNSQC